MSVRAPTLGIELRYWPDNRTAYWSDLIAALFAWEVALRPAAFQVTRGDGMLEPGEQPWDSMAQQRLTQLCAQREAFAWIMGSGSRHFWRCEGYDGRVALSIQIPAPHRPVADHYLDLLQTISIAQPALAMLYRYDDPKASYERQGLRGLQDIPPLLHLGAQLVEQLGGSDRMRLAPCAVRETPGGGLLFIVRENPFGKPSRVDRDNALAVARILGIADDRPMICEPQ